MATTADYLSQIQALTKQNLDILKAINDSFFTKRTHLEVSVSDPLGNNTEYVLPSFLALENKVNLLEENFNNLVDAPRSGSAHVYTSDSGSRTIQVDRYTVAPPTPSITPSGMSGLTFDVDANVQLFKDLLLPNPYIRVDLSNVPDYINRVVVRKVLIRNNELNNTIYADYAYSNGGDMSDEEIEDSLAGGITEDTPYLNLEYSSLQAITSSYTEGVDYEFYDKCYDLPLKSPAGVGSYRINSIINDYVDDSLNEYVTVSVSDSLTYTINNETDTQYLRVGDRLVNGDETCILEINEINFDTSELTLRVLNGDYLNLIASTTEDYYNTSMIEDIRNNNILKFYRPVDFDEYKYLDIPVTNDQFVCVFVASVNSDTNMRSDFSSGFLINAQGLMKTNEDIKLKEYFESNITNIGDALVNMACAMGSPITKFAQNEFNSFSQYKPSQDHLKVKVIKINGHLDDNTSIQNIRDLYNQKQVLQNKRVEIQNQISELNEVIASVAFNDTTGIRSTFNDQLSSLINERNVIDNNILTISNSINQAANESVSPIDSPKYRARGYYDFESQDNVLDLYRNNIKAIRVRYRYKNQNGTITTSSNIDEKFTFSDWNDLPINYRNKTSKEAKSSIFKYDDYMPGDNTPKFNQIDIPITQGEMIEMKLQIIWDFGSPFIEITSDWSDIYQINFPEEYVKSVEIEEIIKENNSDIELSRFNNILSINGTINHVDDKVVDQDVIFYHKPENIASGFYTPERRNIPLSEKLKEMNDLLISLKDEVNNSSLKNVDCSIIIDNVEYNITPDVKNTIYLDSYEDTIYDNSSEPQSRLRTTTAMLTIKNPSAKNSVNLYSLFPGRSNNTLDELDSDKTKYDKSNYAGVDNDGKKYGVWMSCSRGTGVDYQTQSANQWITFRMNDPYTNEAFYALDGKPDSKKYNTLNFSISPKEIYDKYVINSNGNLDNLMYSYLDVPDEDYLKLNSNQRKYLLGPESYLNIPIVIRSGFNLHNGTDRLGDNTAPLSTTMCFELCLSLYDDPINIVIEFVADYKQNSSHSLQNSRIVNLSSNNSLTNYSTTIV